MTLLFKKDPTEEGYAIGPKLAIIQAKIYRSNKFEVKARLKKPNRDELFVSPGKLYKFLIF